MWSSTPTKYAFIEPRRRVRPHRTMEIELFFLAAPLGEVASAVCAEVGGVIFQFYLYPHHRKRFPSPCNKGRLGKFLRIFYKPLSHGRAVTAPLKGRPWCGVPYVVASYVWKGVVISTAVYGYMILCLRWYRENIGIIAGL